MISASGFIKAEESDYVESILSELKSRGIEVSEVDETKISFQIIKNSISDLKDELDSLRKTAHTKDVYLSYYSLEGDD